MNPFVDVTSTYERSQGGERWIRELDSMSWVSVLCRLTGEWETALVLSIEPGSHPKRDCLVIPGDRREELATMPKERLRDWYAANIEGNRNSFETLIEALRPQPTN